MSQKVIAQIEPAQFDFFTKIFSKISDKSSFEPICIEKSKLIRRLDAGIVSIDFKELFNGEVDLKVLDHKKASKVFKSIKTDNPITIIEDIDKYIVTYPYTAGNKQYVIMFTITKTDSCEDEINLPDLNKFTKLDEVKIDKEIFDTVRKISKVIGTDDVQFLLDENNKIAAIVVGNESQITLNENSNINLDNANLVLKSSSFLIFDAEEITIEIYQNDDTYYGVFKLELGFPIDFTIYETLVNTEDEIEF